VAGVKFLEYVLKMHTLFRNAYSLKAVLLSFVALCLSCSNLHAAQAQNSWRNAFEIVARGSYLLDADSQKLGVLYSTGIDARKVFAGNKRNVATVNLQLDVWCTDNQARRPPFFEHDHDCESLVRNASVNFHASGDGKLNILIGHTELPFGLEVPVSTSKSLRTLLTPRDLAMKLDWGVGINGTLGKFDYSALLSRGSGIEYRHNKDPWSFTARVGHSINRQRFLPEPGLGLSIFRGNVLLNDGVISKRERIALDGVRYFNRFGLVSQFSFGDTDDRDTWNGLVELNWSDSIEAKVGYIQYKSYNEDFQSGWKRAKSASIGARFGQIAGLTWAVQYTREFSSFTNNGDQDVIDFQLKYRWE
jgi:hypothetical protein